MKERLLIEELVRIREMMGFSGYNKKLLLEFGRQLADEAMPGGIMDDLAALGKTVDDIFSYSTKLANDFPTRTFDSIVEKVADENGGISPGSVTKEMMQEFFAKSGVFDDLTEVATKLADEKVGGYMTDVNFTNAFNNAGQGGLPGSVQVVVKQKITAQNKSTTESILEQFRRLIESDTTLKNSDAGKKMLDTINNKKKEIADFDANEVRKSTSTGGVGGRAGTGPTQAEIDAAMDALTNRISNIDTTSESTIMSSLNSILDELETNGLIKYPKGVTKEMVVKDLTAAIQRLSNNAQAAEAAFNKLTTAEQAEWAQKVIKDLENARAKVEGDPNKPGWFKRTFFSWLNETAEVGKKGNKIEPIKIVKGFFKIYFLIGGISFAVCAIKNIWDFKQEGVEGINSGKDFADCLFTIATWAPDGIVYLLNLGEEVLDTDYENTPESFRKWADTKEVKDKYKYIDSGYDADGKTYYFKINDGTVKDVKFDADNQTWVVE